MFPQFEGKKKKLDQNRILQNSVSKMEKTINIILQIFSVRNIPIVCKKRWKQKIKQKNEKITRQQKVMIKYKIFVKSYKNTYNIDKMKRIQQNIQKPKQISIPSSNSSQQILTPHWGGHQKYQVPKMSRLDQLLSRNQQIYQNMRNQLMEISRSNRNIDVNINNIKPLYQSQCTEQENIQEQSDSNYYMQYPQQTEQNNQIPPNFIYSQSTYKQPYTFQQKSSIDQNSQSPPKIIISRPKQTSNSSNSRLAQNYTKSKQHTVTKSHITNSSQSLSSYPSSSHKNKFIYSLGESLGSTYNGRGGQGPHAQEHIQKSIFQESDSSPIESQKFASKQIYYMAKNQNHIDAPPYKFRKKSSHNTINQVSLNLSQASKKSMNKREQKQLEKRKSSSFLKKSEQVISYQVASERKNYQDQQNKYQTYEQDPNISLRVEQKSNHTKNKGSNILVYKQNYAEQYFPSIMHNKQKNKYPSNVNLKIKINSLLNGNENKLRSSARLPQKLSVIFIPFNRLYSSPILQQSNKKQLTLARKSRTHTTSNNLVNRIICGKKYKNIHMINQQVNLYQNILQYIGQVQEVLKMKRKLLSQNKGNIQLDYIEKQSVDIGIVGGQNSLKKKIHYALIAHIYTDLLKLIKNYYQQQTKKENIQNNQETLQEIQSQVQAQNKISKIMIGIEHQEQQAMSDPYVIRYQGQISQESIQNQIVYGNIRAVIQAIFQCMKMKLPNTQPSQTNTISNRIRVTKLFLKIPIHTRSQNYASSDSNNAETQKANKQYLSVHNTKIVSTNNLNRQLITKLQLDAIIWCVNPLFKYFDQTQTLLDCYTAFKTHLKANNKEK